MITLEDAISAVTAGLADAERAAGNWRDDPTGWHRRHNAAIEALNGRLAEHFGARIVDNWNGARVTMMKITASSTSGVAGALRNWRVTAHKRLLTEQEKQP